MLIIKIGVQVLKNEQMLCILKAGKIIIRQPIGGFMEFDSDPKPNGMDGEEEEDGG